jgi:hypothetical protein
MLKTVLLTLILLTWRIVWAPNSIPVYSYIQQNVTLHSLFISENYSTCFGRYFHPSSGAHTIVSTASGICQTVTAICRYRGRVGPGLSVLWVAYVTHSTLKERNSFLTGTQESHLQRVTMPEAAYIQLRRRPPEDEQANARNMSASDCLVNRLRNNFFLNRYTGQSPADSDDTRGCMYTITT